MVQTRLAASGIKLGEEPLGGGRYCLSAHELAAFAVFAGLAHIAAISFKYIVFHSFIELVSIVLAATVATLAISCRRTITDQYVLVVGVSYVFVGLIDLLHTMSFKGMGIFTDYDYYAPQFWIAARYLEALSMLGGFVFVGSGRQANVAAVAGSYAVVTVAVIAAILYFKVFPVCFVAGEGLTPFKIVSEYVICGLLATGLVMLYRRRRLFDERVYRLLHWSLVLMIVMELCFTLYVSDAMSDSFNEIGHMIKVLAFAMVYKAVVVTGLQDPMRQLFRSLKASEESLLEAQKLAGLGRWEWAPGADRWGWSDEVGRLLGVSGSQSASLPVLLAAVQAEDHASLQRRLQAAADTGAAFEIMLHLGAGAGAIRFAQMRGEAQRGDGGEITRVAGTMQDVTINLFSVEGAHDTVAWVTPSGYFAYVNLAATTLLGYSRDALMAMHISEISRTQPTHAFAEQWRLLKSRGTLRFETELIRKDGAAVPVDISENHVAFDHDEYNVMFIRDMTAHKAAEAKITTLKDLYAALSRTNQAIIHCDDRQALFDEVVKVAVTYGHFRLAWIGLTDPETLAVRPVAVAGEAAAYVDGLIVSTAADTPFGDSPIGRCIRAGAFVIANAVTDSPLTRPWRERQRQFGFQSEAAFPIKNGDTVVGALTLYSDTAEFFTPVLINLLSEMTLDISAALDRLDLQAANREQEEKLRRALDVLAASNAELERFTFVASHDLQEPLRTIMTYTQVLERRLGSELSGQDRTDFDTIVGAAGRMRTLIKDLLEYSQITTRAVPFAPVDLNAACNMALARLQGSLNENRGVVDVGQLPTVNGDDVQLTQLFQNLLSNSIKFHREGETLCVRIAATRDGADWLITLCDNGIGIEATEQDVFDVFRRLHPGTRYPGSGVGLAICRRIVQRHGGRIWYEPVPDGGEGTCFKFTLPAPPSPASPSPGP